MGYCLIMAIKINGDNTSATPGITGSDADTGVSFGTDEVAINTGGTERVKVDSSGRVGIGSSSPSHNLEVKGSFPDIAIVDSDTANDRFRILHNGGSTQLQVDPSNVSASSHLLVAIDGTERMRISDTGIVKAAMGNFADDTVRTNSTNGGFVINNNTNELCQIAKWGGPVLGVNRLNNDGQVLTIIQGGTPEGSINVSGTSVSYNGGHLSRWSQLPSGAERIEILRGSVLSNIDEMCEWGEEDNEQLNRMQVSNVEGDPNVSGVFQSWDDDDDTYTNDFYCAMTGDFVIRVAQGTTVARGDLLMSAGDGTAKPQDDDIVRSKTIAKVTSTNVSCTYDDGSYCVPCVLMAC